jgi:hypothetical protein
MPHRAYSSGVHCGSLVETLPAHQHDPKRPEDLPKVDADEDGVGGDDAADALRYLVTDEVARADATEVAWAVTD